MRPYHSYLLLTILLFFDGFPQQLAHRIITQFSLVLQIFSLNSIFSLQQNLHRIENIKPMNHQRGRRRQQHSIFQRGAQLGKHNNTSHPDRIKADLIERLKFQIDNIGNTKKMGLCADDQVIKQLQRIEEQAKTYDLKQIVRVVNLAIGKRILNLELERKRNEIEKKIEKKRQIQSYFRQNRINKTNYQEIALQKLHENTLIARPFNDGKAFIESTYFYKKIIGSLTGNSYDRYMEECQYLQTLKTVNKIFFNCISSSSPQKSKKWTSNNPILKIGLVLFATIVLLCIINGVVPNSIITYIIFSINLVMLLMMGGLALYSFFNFKLGNNHVQESILKIQQHFTKINERSKKLGLNHQWICPSHFLYLQVKFDHMQ